MMKSITKKFSMRMVVQKEPVRYDMMTYLGRVLCTLYDYFYLCGLKSITFFRDIADNSGTYNNNITWVRSFVIDMGSGSVGMDCWLHFSTQLFDHNSVYFSSSGELLSMSIRQEKLLLHGCCQVQTR